MEKLSQLVAKSLDENHLMATQLNHLIFPLFLILNHTKILYLSVLYVLPNALTNRWILYRCYVLNPDSSSIV